MLRDRIGKDILYFDGGFGSELQKLGLTASEIPEFYNIDKPEIVLDIHKRYLRAGADFITTNTFGCNSLKMKNCKYLCKDMIKGAINIAQKAKMEIQEEYRCNNIIKDIYIVLDIGPLGELLEPSGTLSFDDAYELFKEQVLIAKDHVDAILIETMSDLYEVKAAILAVKENSDLPVFVSMTFEANKRTLCGTDPLTYVNVVEGLGVDVLGVNCSLGPKELKPILDDILEISTAPILIQPNAGLPSLENGKTLYNITLEEYCDAMEYFMKSGVSLVGGCCGTTPEFIKGLVDKGYKTVNKRTVKRQTIVSSHCESVIIDKKTIVCGERLNPTGKKKLKQALLDGNYEECIIEAIKQKNAGAHVLDVNVGVPGINEVETMVKVIKLLQEVITLPLQIDSSNPKAIEAACRYYNGKPLINSVNGKLESMKDILPIVKKYGGVVIGLTLDEEIPYLAEERVEIAQRILDGALSYGIRKEDVIIDCLTLTASAQQKEVKETLKALDIVKNKMRLHTVLGVSNVSFGLPNRLLLNKTFLILALQSGLSLPIINPLDKELMDAIDAYEVLYNIDKDGTSYIQRQSQQPLEATQNTVSSFSLEDIIESGLKDEVQNKVRELLTKEDSLDIINNRVIPSLNKVGEGFERNKVFLPQLIQSAETTKLAFEILKTTFASQESSKGTLLICSVEGDIHDIGKNIVRVVLESYGYKVIDLGKSVKARDVVDACLRYKPDMIGLSALMTTTVINMEKTIIALREANISCPIWVGGAVLTKEIAEKIEADYYSKDAMDTVHLLEAVL